MSSENNDGDWDELFRLEEFDDAAEAALLEVKRVQFSRVKPLQDFAAGANVYQWFRFEYEGDRLGVAYCGKGGILGDLPEWYLEDGEDTKEQLDFRYDKTHPTNFALSLGISPGQPFLVEFRPPE